MTTMERPLHQPLLLGEWACLGILYQGRSHGFAVARRLRPDGDIGRVWSLSRPLTYRALDQLVRRELVHAVAEERGIAGGNRTVLAVTRRGRARFRDWVATPVAHLRDLRSELLLKLVLAEQCGLDVRSMVAAQQARIAELNAVLGPPPAADADVVALWRYEASEAARRFVDRLSP